MLIYSVSSCFSATKAELNSCHRNHMACHKTPFGPLEKAFADSVEYYLILLGLGLSVSLSLFLLSSFPPSFPPFLPFIFLFISSLCIYLNASFLLQVPLLILFFPPLLVRFSEIPHNATISIIQLVTQEMNTKFMFPPITSPLNSNLLFPAPFSTRMSKSHFELKSYSSFKFQFIDPLLSWSPTVKILICFICLPYLNQLLIVSALPHNFSGALFLSFHTAF